MNDYGVNFRSPKVDIHQFSMVPRADIPRSSFVMQHQHKTTFSASLLIPIYLQEILPGDSFNVSMSAFCRLATPLYPIMDNMDLETFFFFVPNRLVWTHWPFFMGEQNNPNDSITYSIPQVVSPVGGFAQFSVFDYMGLPTAGQTAAGNTISVSALPFRGLNLIINTWFRDQNLAVGWGVGTTGPTTPAGVPFFVQSDDGPDPITCYGLFPVAKRPDYFTTCLPWTQKGNPVTLPLGTTATVKTAAGDLLTGAQNASRWLQTGGTSVPSNLALFTTGGGSNGGTLSASTTAGTISGTSVYPSNLYADLSTATAATINSIRLAFQTQRLLERDARSGTRYVESILAHFGVRSPDYRLMRPEYLGGGKSPVNIAPVPQTATFGTNPLGSLAAAGTAVAKHGFQYSATEHGYIIGVATVRNDKIYQQGIRKLWSRLTRYDFYLPVFAMLGEQAVLTKEIYSDGSGNDALVFGYQERWAELRYHPSYTSAYFRSTTTTPLDAWHLAQKFTAQPLLNNSFINDDLGTTFQRCAAAGALSANQQILADFFFTERAARLMPMYSVPGMIDHF